MTVNLRLVPNDLRPVAIVGMGRSASAFWTERTLGVPGIANADVWTINVAALGAPSDIAFHMDPVDLPEYKAHWDMFDQLARRGTKVLSSRPSHRWKNVEAYPLQAVVDDLKAPYLTTTVAYALALAVHQRRPMIALYGCDFTYPDVHAAEAGRACVEYWLGRAHAFGIPVTIPHSSTLFDAPLHEVGNMYGYRRDEQDIAAGVLTYDEAIGAGAEKEPLWASAPSP